MRCARRTRYSSYCISAMQGAHAIVCTGCGGVVVPARPHTLFPTPDTANTRRHPRVRTCGQGRAATGNGRVGGLRWRGATAAGWGGGRRVGQTGGGWEERAGRRAGGQEGRTRRRGERQAGSAGRQGSMEALRHGGREGVLGARADHRPRTCTQQEGSAACAAHLVGWCPHVELDKATLRAKRETMPSAVVSQTHVANAHDLPAQQTRG